MLGPPLARGRYKSCSAVFVKKSPRVARKAVPLHLLCGTELYTAQLTGFQLTALRTEKPRTRYTPSRLSVASPRVTDTIKAPSARFQRLSALLPPNGKPTPEARRSCCLRPLRRGGTGSRAAASGSGAGGGQGETPAGGGLTRSLGLAPSPRTARLRAAGSGQRARV